MLSSLFQNGPLTMDQPIDLARPKASSAKYCYRMGPLLRGGWYTWEMRQGGG